MGKIRKAKPTFSIITVVYNAVELIEGTMKTVFNQTFRDFEYIIIDGKSTDGTLSIIEKYRDKIDILVSEPDNGIYDAMNKAISLSSGSYINFMNCGDFFANDEVLMNVSEKIQESPDVIYGNTIICTIVGKYLVRPENLEDSIMRHMPFCHQSTFVKIDAARQHLFDLTYKVAADYNMFMQLYKEDKLFMYVDFVIAIYQNDSKIVNRQSYKRIVEAAKVNKNFRTLIRAFKRYIGGYLRSLFPVCLYKFYRKQKYSHNSRYEFIGY